MFKYTPKTDWSSGSRLYTSEMANYINLIFELRDVADSTDTLSLAVEEFDFSFFLPKDKGYNSIIHDDFPLLPTIMFMNRNSTKPPTYTSSLSQGRYTSLPRIHAHKANAVFTSFTAGIPIHKDKQETEFDVLGNPVLGRDLSSFHISQQSATPIMSTQHTSADVPELGSKVVATLALPSGSTFRINSLGEYELRGNQSAQTSSYNYHDLIKRGQIKELGQIQNAHNIGFDNHYIALIGSEGAFALFNPYTGDMPFNEKLANYLSSPSSTLWKGTLDTFTHQVEFTPYREVQKLPELETPLTFLMGAKVKVKENFPRGFYSALELPFASNVTHSVYSFTLMGGNGISVSFLVILEGNRFSKAIIMDTAKENTATQFLVLAEKGASHQSNYILWDRQFTSYFFGEEFNQKVSEQSTHLNFIVAPDSICVTSWSDSISSRLFYQGESSMLAFPEFKDLQLGFNDFFLGHGKQIAVLGYTFPTGALGNKDGTSWLSDVPAPPTAFVVLQAGTNIILAKLQSHSETGLGLGKQVVAWSIAGLQSLSISPSNPSKSEAMLALSNGLGSQVISLVSAGAYVGISHYVGDMVAFCH